MVQRTVVGKQNVCSTCVFFQEAIWQLTDMGEKNARHAVTEQERVVKKVEMCEHAVVPVCLENMWEDVAATVGIWDKNLHQLVQMRVKRREQKGGLTPLKKFLSDHET